MNHILTSDHIKIYYEYYASTGEPPNRSIVLIHGAGLNSSFFSRVVSLLRSKYHVIVYDLRGHGRSGDSAVEITWERLTDDLLALLRHLNLTSVIVAGHGFGSNVAAQFALQYEAMVESLILFSPPLLLLSETHRKDMEFRKTLAQLPTLAALGEFMVKRITSLHDDENVAAKLVQAYERVRKETYFDYLKLSLHRRPLEQLRQVGKPVLLMSGELDPFYTPVISSLSCSLFQYATFFVVPNASNMVFLDQPIYTSEWISYFVQKHAGSPASVQRHDPFAEEINAYVRHLLHAGCKALLEGPVIKVRAMNGFEVTLGDREIKQGWSNRYAKNILLYLIHHPSASREDICHALFPGVEMKTALKNLRVYLSYFMKLMNAGDAPPSVIVDRDMIYLNYQADCDVVDFMKELRQAELEKEAAIKLKLCGRLLLQLPKQPLKGFSDPFSRKLKETLCHSWRTLAFWSSDYCAALERMEEAAAYLKSCMPLFPEDEEIVGRLAAIRERTGKGM